MRHHHGCAVSILVGALLLFSSYSALAHEVPSDLTVDTFVKPENHVLRVAIRVPLSGLMGIDMPKEGVGYLALNYLDPALQKTAQLMVDGLDLYENDSRLTSPRLISTRVSLPFDTSFASYETALAHLTGPGLPNDTQIYWLQGSVDALIDYPIRSDRSSFSFRTRLTTLAPQVTTALRFLPPDGSIRSFTFLGDPGSIWLDPRWYQVVPVFFKDGLRYIVGIRDQWIFALCILISSRRLRSLPMVLTSFGIAHVLTSLTIAFGPDASGPWLSPLLAAVVAAFLLCFAIENIAARQLDRRWTVLWFGVVAGIGFSIAMRDLAQFAGHHQLTSILSFDLGVQTGELILFGVASLPLLLVARLLVGERLRTIILSALVADLAWTALKTRTAALGDVQWPLLTPAAVVNATSWLIVLVIAIGAVWFILGLQRSFESRATPSLGPVRE